MLVYRLPSKGLVSGAVNAKAFQSQIFEAAKHQPKKNTTIKKGRNMLRLCKRTNRPTTKHHVCQEIKTDANVLS